MTQPINATTKPGNPMTKPIESVKVQDDNILLAEHIEEIMAIDAAVHDAAIDRALWAIEHTSLFNGGEFLHGLHSSASFKYAAATAVLALKSQPVKDEPADENKKVSKFKKKLRRLISELINLEALCYDTYHDLRFTNDQLETRRERIGAERDDKEVELDQHIIRIKTITVKGSK